MAKGGYIGVSSKAKKIKKIYIGVGDKAKKVKKAYIGDANGKAKLFYAAGGLFFGAGGSYSPFEYDTSSGVKTQLSQPSQFANRWTGIQYCRGKWVWGRHSYVTQGSNDVYIDIYDEKTHALTSINIVDSSIGLRYGNCAGIATDDNNVYLVMSRTNTSYTYFVTLSMLDYTYTVVKAAFSVATYGDGFTNCLAILPNGKFLVQDSSGYPRIYDRSNNTVSWLTQSHALGGIQERAISSDKIVYLINGYNLAVTDGSTVTTWNDSTGGLTPYNSSEMTYGNGMFIYRSSGGYYISTNNGSSWTKQQSSATNNIGQAKAITFGDGMFFAMHAVGNSGTASLRVSTDAINWTEVATNSFDSPYKCNVAYSAIHGVGK